MRVINMDDRPIARDSCRDESFYDPGSLYTG